ncbi:MAG: leucyl aminopeptidase [Candidatus Dormibacteria bacterium]
MRQASGPAEASAVEVLVVPMAQPAEIMGVAAEVDRRLGGDLGRVVGHEFKGRFGEVFTTLSGGRVKSGRVALVGLGKRELLDGVRLRNALQIALGTLARAGGRKLALVDVSDDLGIKADALVAAASEAAVLSTFDIGSHKTGARPGTVGSLQLFGFEGGVGATAAEAEMLARATNLARELVNLPASVLTPPEYAARAAKVGKQAGLEVEVLGESELRKLGYGALLAVAAGSVHPPQLVVLRYRPPGRRRPNGCRVALVGKGITFDTGGVSIKPAADMHHMKGDMGGSAAVLGAMVATAALRPPVEVIGVLAIAENMVGGRAMRPGDILLTGAGKTVEVLNTDAEGRLVLADAVHHAVTLGATHVIDIATLTGAQRVALGPVAAAFLTNRPALSPLVYAAAERAGERVWELPTFPEYDSMLESTVADLNNSPGRDGGTITAGLFIREFAGGLPWIHFDIAAPSNHHVSSITQLPKGPTGFGVRTLARLVQELAGAQPG